MTIEDACQKLFEELHAHYGASFTVGFGGDRIVVYWQKKRIWYQNPRLTELHWYKDKMYEGFKVEDKYMGQPVAIYAVRGR